MKDNLGDNLYEAEKIKKKLKLEWLLSLKQILIDLKGKAEDVIKKHKEWANQLFNTLIE